MTTVTSSYLTKLESKIEKGPRGFPGPPGPVSGGVYPGAGIANSTGIAWGASYTASGSGTVLALVNAPTFTGNVTMPGTGIWNSSGNAGFGTVSPLGRIHAYHAAGSEFYTVDNVDGIILVNKIDSKSIGFSASKNATYGGNGSAGIKALEGGGVAGAGKVDIINDGAVVLTAKGGMIGVGCEADVKFAVKPTAADDVVAAKLINHFTSGGDALTRFTIGAFNNGYGSDIIARTDGSADLRAGLEFAVRSTAGVQKTTLFVPYAGYLYTDAGLHIGGSSDPGDNNLWVDGINQHPSFASGWQGNNWRIEADGDAEFNNVLIRGGLSVFELIVNQLHYQNGGLIIGAGAGKIDTLDASILGTEAMTFHDPEGNDIVPFTEGAIVIVQRVDINRTDVVKKIVRQVDDITGMIVTLGVTAGWATGDDTGVFEVGDEVVAIGHTSDAALDSCLYMSAIDSGNPFLRVMDGVSTYAKWSLGDKTTVKLQIGNLASLASYDILPASPGYGLYSDNVYLKGLIQATSGLVGGFTINSSEGLYAGTGATRVQMKPGAGFWAGATAIGDAPFRVDEAGNLTAIGVAELGTNATSVDGKTTNVAILGSDIWENASNTDSSAIRINKKGYAGGDTKFRDFIVYDGKGHKVFQIGTASGLAYIEFGNGSDPVTTECTINGFTKHIPQADPPGTPAEGQIYADTDHHLYYYNGSTWKQLDN